MSDRDEYPAPPRPEDLPEMGTSRGPRARWAWVWVALGSALVTALVVFLFMRPYLTLPSSNAGQTTVAPTPVAETSSASPSAARWTAPPAAAPLPSDPPTPTPEPATSQDAACPELDGRWVTDETVIWEPEHLDELVDAPDGFAAFVEAQLGVDDYGCTTQFTILGTHPEGFAVGTMESPEWDDGCGGGAWFIWSDQGGEWGELFMIQDILDCSDLADAEVPENSGLIECFADDQTWWW